MKLRCINKTARLYVMAADEARGTVSCYGFDNAHRMTAAFAAWLERPDLAPPARKGTRKAYAAYQAALAAASAHAHANRVRCPAALTPALIGLEGARVEVQAPGREPRRFWVGKSTGWLPIHLEIARRTSHGGGGAYVPDGARVVVITPAPRDRA